MAKMDLTEGWSAATVLTSRELIQCISGAAVIALGNTAPTDPTDGAVIRRDGSLILDTGTTFRARALEIGTTLYRGVIA